MTKEERRKKRREYYAKNKARINQQQLEYQNRSENYRKYRRKYEAAYREENKELWNYKSTKSIIKKKYGKGIRALIRETDYLLKIQLRNK